MGFAETAPLSEADDPYRTTGRGFFMGMNGALGFVVLLGVVSLFADMTSEGARGITGPFLVILGASATAVGVVAASAGRPRWTAGARPGRSGRERPAGRREMENVWFLAAVWVGLALIATLLAIWFRISTALSEIVVGTVAQLVSSGSAAGEPARPRCPAYAPPDAGCLPAVVSVKHTAVRGERDGSAAAKFVTAA